MEFAELYLEIYEVAGGDANVICIAVFVVGDGEFALTVFGACWYISSPAALYPPHKWLYEEGEEKGGKRVPLEGAPMDRNLRGKSMRGDICGGRGPVELLACPHVAFWQTECPHGLNIPLWSVPLKAPLKSTKAVYIGFLEVLASSSTIMCRRVESYVCLFARKPSELSFIIPSASAMSEPMYVTTVVHSFWMQFISAMGLYEAGVRGSFLLGLNIRQVALIHPASGV